MWDWGNSNAFYPSLALSHRYVTSRNRVCHPGGRCLDYYPVVLSLSQVTATWSSNKFQLLDYMTGHQNSCLNSSSPGQNGRHFPDDIFKCISMNENVWISIKISLKFVPKGPINNIPALVQIMAWRQPGNKPLSEPRMARLPTHVCVARPEWVNSGCQVTSPVDLRYC